ncbi:MAG: sensor histidine kinase [Chitinophagaceae bacterium]|nr:sensor histidine kinase [Chitinophagaceae bacterium]
MAELFKYYLWGFVIALLLLGTFILFLSILFSNKQIKNKKERAELQSQFSQTLLQSQLEIQDQTLQHISHELHDNIGQIASLIKINLNTIQLENVGKAQQKIEDTKELIRQLITDLKGLSVRLNSDRITQFGLIKTLQAEADRINKTGAFSANFASNGADPTLAPEKSIILYRMIQEIINNIIKHSEAKHIDIKLNAAENLFTLVFTDDGIGFNVEEKLTNGGAGLLNLQNRAKLINAQLTIQSTPESGSVFTIEMPS